MNAQLTRTPRERLIEVAEWLEAATPMKAGINSFDMTSWIGKNECGTSCCIGGAIVQFDQAAKGLKTLSEGYVSDIDPDLDESYSDIGDYAGDLCGLNPSETQELFRENMDATPTAPATTIRRYLDSGKLYWDEDGSESESVIRSHQLPTKNSVLLGADGQPLADGDTNIAAVFNTVTGVVRAWKPFGNKRFRHQAAIDAAAALPQLPGHTPWELSPKADLEAILASGNGMGDVFDVEQYPDIVEQWHWAQDLYKSSSDYAWSVFFLTGNVGCYRRGTQNRALAVCRPLPASQQS